MSFWDSSAIVPLLVLEEQTPGLLAAFEADAEVYVWWGSEVECVSALSRRERDGSLPADACEIALQRLDALAASWIQVEPVAGVRRIARRLLRVHELRAGDALQLAAAIVAAEREPSTLEFRSLDERLVAAARREGFPIAASA